MEKIQIVDSDAMYLVADRIRQVSPEYRNLYQQFSLPEVRSLHTATLKQGIWSLENAGLKINPEVLSWNGIRLSLQDYGLLLAGEEHYTPYVNNIREKYYYQDLLKYFDGITVNVDPQKLQEEYLSIAENMSLFEKNMFLRTIDSYVADHTDAINHFNVE